MNLQSNFTSFHDAIELDYDENSLLREYRDQVIIGLKEHLNLDTTFSTFAQGSYAVFTGIKALDDSFEFDIDIALAVVGSREDYGVKALKKQVRDALKETFPDASVDIKNPCVTVSFSDNEAKIHVDVAVYLEENGKLYLGRGKEFSLQENTNWEVADPKGLTDKIKTHFADANDRLQFRRCVRYLKRWKDNKFNQEYRPTGIGITIKAMELMVVSKKTDLFANKSTYNDLEALHGLVSSMINDFKDKYDSKEEAFYERLEAYLPVEPYTDTFCKMTGNQMKDLKQKLINFREDLKFAMDTTDEHEATKKLNKQFGNDFLVTDEEAVTESQTKNVFVSDYPSA